VLTGCVRGDDRWVAARSTFCPYLFEGRRRPTLLCRIRSETRIGKRTVGDTSASGRSSFVARMQAANFGEPRNQLRDRWTVRRKADLRQRGAGRIWNRGVVSDARWVESSPQDGPPFLPASRDAGETAGYLTFSGNCLATVDWWRTCPRRRPRLGRPAPALLAAPPGEAQPDTTVRSPKDVANAAAKSDVLIAVLSAIHAGAARWAALSRAAVEVVARSRLSRGWARPKAMVTARLASLNDRFCPPGLARRPGSTSSDW
jgi:hypothetical protein